MKYPEKSIIAYSMCMCRSALVLHQMFLLFSLDQRSCLLFFIQTPNYLLLQAEFNEASSAILAGIESGWLKPFVGKEYPLQDASVAHDDIIKTTSAQGRMVLIP